MGSLDDQWSQSRRGSHSGRGFHYQDAVATHIAILGWAHELPIREVIPEGHEDISVQVVDGWIHIQAKSRRSHLGAFDVGEVIDHLAETWTAHEQRAAVQPNSRVALVLERPIRCLPTTGWGRTIAEDPTLSAVLRPRLQGKLRDLDRVEKLISTMSVIEIAEPREASLVILAQRLTTLPRSVCTVHYQSLRDLIQELADQNGVSPASNPARLSLGDIQKIFDESTEKVDVESLDAALRDGICEIVDFRTPLPDDRFFQGIDVKPGHVAAGLPVERPELEAEITTELEANRPVLIVGPSGAGKSAAAWMAAHASRHLIRWYRVRRLDATDVTPLLRTVRAAHPTNRSPVGLVVDDLGHSDQQGWDSLVAEAAHLPGVRLLGVIREEDLPLVESAPACYQARPLLDETLAARIWEKLRSANATAWQEWREPFEQSERLLLEYGYLLTTGERLRNTITSQVDRRIRERRDLELRVLRLIAAADVWGATVELNGVRQLLTSETDEDLQRAFKRLVDEHLVRQTASGNFVGLHRVRSRHILEASHRLGVPALHETISRVVSVLGLDSLQRFTAGVLAEEVVVDDAVLVSLSHRLRSTPDPRVLIAALQALRLVSFVRLASGWTQILGEEQVPPSKRVVAAELALAEASNENLQPSIQAAITRMTTTLRNDLRARFLGLLGGEVFITSSSRSRTLRRPPRFSPPLLALQGSQG